MSKKTKFILLIVSIIILILLVLMFVGVFNKDRDNNSDDDSGNNSTNNSQQVTTLSTFEISNLLLERETNDDVAIMFKLTNKENKAINNKTLKINFYEGENLLHTYDYLMTDLGASESVYIQVTAVFKHQKITKYEFIIDDSKEVIIPTE